MISWNGARTSLVSPGYGTLSLFVSFFRVDLCLLSRSRYSEEADPGIKRAVTRIGGCPSLKLLCCPLPDNKSLWHVFRRPEHWVRLVVSHALLDLFAWLSSLYEMQHGGSNSGGWGGGRTASVML